MIELSRRTFGLASLAAAAAAGCHRLLQVQARKLPPPSEPTFSQYHLPGWDWGTVDRVVILSFLNESEHTQAGEEVRAAFASEFQKMGRFEIVSAPQDDQAILAKKVRVGGRFNEAVMLDIARMTRADVIIHGTVSFYSPYPRPRIGIVIQAVSPQDAKVVASVDGLWDTTDSAVADRVRTFYRQRPRPRPPWIRNHVIAKDDGFADELALDSPALFQRAICREVVVALLGLQMEGIALPTPGTGPTPACSKCP